MIDVEAKRAKVTIDALPSLIRANEGQLTALFQNLIEMRLAIPHRQSRHSDLVPWRRKPRSLSSDNEIGTDSAISAEDLLALSTPARII